MPRPRKPDNIAKRNYIGVKATKEESERWREAVALFGASRCLEISLDALEKAVIEYINALASSPDANHDKRD